MAAILSRPQWWFATLLHWQKSISATCDRLILILTHSARLKYSKQATLSRKCWCQERHGCKPITYQPLDIMGINHVEYNRMLLICHETRLMWLYSNELHASLSMHIMAIPFYSYSKLIAHRTDLTLLWWLRLSLRFYGHSFHFELHIWAFCD